MKSIRMALCLTACALAVSFATTVLADETPTVEMKVVPENAVRTLTHGYMPQRVQLVRSAPSSLKKKPEMEAPVYAQLKFGGKNYVLALDEPQGKPAKLYIDANGNGDLTDDPEAEWKQQSNGGQSIYMGSFKLPLKAGGDESQMVKLVAYRFDPKDPSRAALSHSLLYYADYACEGQIKIGDASYRTVLTNDAANGDFRGESTGPMGGGRLMIDINGDGKFDPRAETFDPHKPFNIKGTTWKIADMKADGNFKLEKSAQRVAEIPLPADLSKGHDALAFTATMMNGKQVKFPQDYKGKIVLLDFWATWCGPCMGEVPGLVKTYNEYHPKGFEVLGISLDQPNSANKVISVTKQQGMTWPQVYDGKFWQARIAQMYFIESIPHAFLVDGDSGKILVEGDALRGEQLAGAVQKALEQKAKDVIK